MKDKLTIIIKPIVLSLIILVIGYTFLHWLFFIELQLFSIKNAIVEFSIPMVLSVLIAWIYIRPKLKILNLEVDTGSLLDFYTVIIWIGLMIPLTIAQSYIQTLTGKLTELNTINDINNYEKTKYYTLKNYYIDKDEVRIYHDYEVITTKTSSNLRIMMYVALPIYESKNYVNLKSPIAWLGHEYTKTISNRLSIEQKQAKEKEFIKESQEDFNSRDFSKFLYFNRLENSQEFDGFSNAIKTNEKFNITNIILVGINEPYSERNGNKLFWIFASSLISLIIWSIMIMIPNYNIQELNRVKAGKPDIEAQQDLKDFVEYMTFKDEYIITPLILYGIVLMYLIMIFGGYGFLSFKGNDLVKFGANYGPITKSGEWWRLLTNIFLHGGIMHLIVNVSGLLFVSFILEPLLGKVKYILLFVLSGIIASWTSLWWHNPAVISVGASGAIFGLYGAFLSLSITKLVPKEERKVFLIFSLIFIVFNLLFGLTGRVDNAAHIGGLLSGFVIGFIFYFLKNYKNS